MKRNMVLAGFLVMVAGGSASAQEKTDRSAALPGGASSVTEDHGDWTVSCTLVEGKKSCVMSQALGRPGTQERLLALELVASRDSMAEGMLLSPFGLRLADGVKFNVDEEPPMDTQPFMTCIETGCLVPVSFTGKSFASLQSGKQLGIAAVNASNGNPVKLSVSLSGFSAAYARVKELSR